MRNSVDLSGLNNFVSKLEKAHSTYDPKKIGNYKENVEKIALDEISNSYAELGISAKKVNIDEKTSKIVVKSKGIGFDEFGTGFYAQGTYEGKLPTQTLVFKSAGKTRATSGWKYYYPNDDTKREKNGLKGWYVPPRTGFPNGSFHTGKIASNRFYRSCKRIRERIKLLWQK